MAFGVNFPRRRKNQIIGGRKLMAEIFENLNQNPTQQETAPQIAEDEHETVTSYLKKRNGVTLKYLIVGAKLTDKLCAIP